MYLETKNKNKTKKLLSGRPWLKQKTRGKILQVNHNEKKYMSAFAGWS